MKDINMDTVIMGSKKLYNKIRMMVNIADKLSWFNPKRTLLYVVALIYAILYAASSPLFYPINFIRRHWARGLAKANLIKLISK